jgi:hypothetical protein
MLYLQEGAVAVEKSLPSVREWLYRNADNVRGKQKIFLWDADKRVTESELSDFIRTSLRDDGFRREFRKLIEAAVERAILEHKGRVF